MTKMGDWCDFDTLTVYVCIDFKKQSLSLGVCAYLGHFEYFIVCVAK